MAQPVNTVDTYGLVGIREDLSDTIYRVSKEDTPMLTALAKSRASNTLHEWQTDAIQAAGDNAHIEGDDTVAESRNPTVRLGNYTQIFKNAVVTSGTEGAVTKAGRATEMAYQSMMVAIEHKRDMEFAIFQNQARSAGSSVAPRRMAGMGAWVATNTVNVGSGGSDPTGDGTNARTDGTQTAFTQTDLNQLLQDIWSSGGKSRTKKVFLSPFQVDVATGFTGNNNQRNPVKEGRISDYIDVYMTNFGTLEWVPSDLCRGRDVWVVDPSYWGWAVLRPTRNQELAKTGDNEKRQIITEATLVSRNEKASGLVADCSTS